MLTAKDQQIIVRARRHGIVVPLIAYEEFKSLKNKPSGMDFALICAFLIQESGGGSNLFGHDPTIFVGAGKVTKAKYLAYRQARGPHGQGGMQGVGPLQLTWYSYQDAADKFGGCWQPQFNIRVGLGIIASNIRQHGLWAGVAAYNGSGVAAQRYANEVLHTRATFAHLLASDTARLELLASVRSDEREDLAAFGRVQIEQDKIRLTHPDWLPH